MLWAQDSLPVMTPVSGWFNTLVQTGSFGLLVYLVVRWLPQIKQSYDKTLETFAAEQKLIREASSKEAEAQRRMFAEECERQRKNCDERAERIEARHDRNLGKIMETFERQATIQQRTLEAMQHEIEGMPERRDKQP
jgi:hypothetical protein